METLKNQKNNGVRWVSPKNDTPKDCDPVLAVIDGSRGLEDLEGEYTIASHSNRGWGLEDLDLDDFKVLLWAEIPEYDPENPGPWTPIEEEAPKTNNYVLVVFDGKCNGFAYEECPAVASYEKDGWELKDVHMDSFRVLAWMNILNWYGGTMKGKLYVIEGLDGSGKATQAELLFNRMTAAGIPARKVSFPDYESDSSALVKMYLAGKFGSDPMDVNAYAASTFYAVDRFASYKSDWGKFYEQGGVIVADRYTTSNAVHQCSKLPEVEWDGFLEWLFHFEYELLGIPAPDAVVYLEVDPEVSQKLMTSRYKGDESQKDIHEKNVEYLCRSGKAAAYCASHLGWKTIKCCAKGQMRDITDINMEITETIKNI